MDNPQPSPKGRNDESIYYNNILMPRPNNLELN